MAMPAINPKSAYVELSPSFVALTRDVLFGDVWERSELSKRDRSMITVATLIALNRTEQLGGHLRRALENGVTRVELTEMIQHLAFYGGWPVAVNAFNVAKEVFDESKG